MIVAVAVARLFARIRTGRCLPWRTKNSARQRWKSPSRNSLRRCNICHGHHDDVFAGGSQSEVELPEILNHLRPKDPPVELRYAWPFDLQLIAKTLTEQLKGWS